jgi:hypothetical protein
MRTSERLGIKGDEKMAEIIQEIFCDPPIVIARLGGSTTPVAAYNWEDSPDPRSEGDTVIVPDWSFAVLPDGSVRPFKPDTIEFRDGNLIRPVCPFVEIWARLGERGSAEAEWRDVPLTETLLATFGADRSAVTFTIDARNLKAARRAQSPDLAFGLFPSLNIRGDQHTPVPLHAVSPPGVARPMIPAGRHIPLGFVQVMRPRPNPPGPNDWPETLDLDVIRLRFTPGRGEFYGPRQAARATPESVVPAVTMANAFLDSGAGWFNSTAQGGGFVVPGDTFDFFQVGQTQHALGVVDDTCEGRIELELRLAGAAATSLRAHANILVGPPDFAPDRRPFLSIADELNDRSADAAARNVALTGADLDLWIEDLFTRAYETVSLMNVDHWRAARGLRGLSGDRLAPTPIPGETVTPENQAMGSRDALRNRDLRVVPGSADVPLPLSAHARQRHRSLAAVERLRDLVASSPTRLKSLVRGPFEVENGEGGNATTMRMPPFMRQSNASPLTLAAWQYALLMRWVDEQELRPEAPTIAAAAVLRPPDPNAPLRPLTQEATARRAEVLARLDRGSQR